MLGVKTYEAKYIKQCKARIDAQLVAYAELAAAAAAADKPKLNSALADFEPQFFNNMVLALDNLFVHRLRGVEGKDGNQLNEVRVICESLANHGGKMTVDKQIKLNPETSVLHYEAGDKIALSEDDFARLSKAFLGEIKKKFS